MEKVSRVLVLMDGGGSFREPQQELLRRCLPDASFDFSRSADGFALEKYDVIIGNPPVGRLPECASLKLLQLTMAGTGNFPNAVRAMDHPVILTNATGAYGPAIAEHMLGMLLALQKNLHLYRDCMSEGQWRDAGEVTSLSGARVLVVGMGDIGGCFGRLCTACGAHVTGVRRTVGSVPDYAEDVRLTEELDELLPTADIVALSVPETRETIHLLSRERIARMKKGAFVLNVGRGSAIDTDALCDALESGHLAGAGLDVTQPEPLPRDHRLWQMKNALITPHVSGGDHLYATVERVASIAAENLVRFTRGERLRNIVDFETGYRRPDSIH